MFRGNDMRVAILTVSDRAHSGEYRDETGPVIAEMLVASEVVANMIVPDERQTIALTLQEWCDRGDIDLILTNGGTGLAKRDVTPEATLDVVDRTIPWHCGANACPRALDHAAGRSVTSGCRATCRYANCQSSWLPQRRARIAPSYSGSFGARSCSNWRQS